MKALNNHGQALLVACLLSCATLPVLAQQALQVFPATQNPGSPWHVDEFFMFVNASDVGRPIAVMTLDLFLSTMNQVNPNGTPTVFRTSALSPALVDLDSHFLLNPSQFTVVSQEESDFHLSATVQFTEPVVFAQAGGLVVAQAIAQYGHTTYPGIYDGSFGSFVAGGQFTDGGSCGGGMIIIPEPAILTLCFCGLGMLSLAGIWHRKATQKMPPSGTPTR